MHFQVHGIDGEPIRADGYGEVLCGAPDLQFEGMVPAMIINAFVDQANSATDSEWLGIAAACAEQHREHVAPQWNLPPTQSVYLTDPSQAQPGMRLIIAKDVSDDPGAIAYHTELNGIPVSYCFMVTAQENGDPPSVPPSHETAEMDGNPLTDSAPKWALAPDGYEYAVELCDATEGDSYPIGPNNMLVSNFLYPSFFDPNGKAPYDHMGLVTRPFETRPKGYQIRRDPKTGNIDQVFGEKREQWRIDTKNHPASRTQRIIRASAMLVRT